MSDHVELIQAMYEGFARGDIDAVVSAMDSAIIWHEAEHSPYHVPGGHHGPQAIVGNVLARVAADFHDFEVVPTAFRDAGTTILVEARYRGTAKATAAPLDAEVCHIWTVRDGKATGFQQYTDTWQFAQVTGHRPQ